jgi:class 3 adenylate cyclase
MTEAIAPYQGTIDEFIGDAILVLFGAPIHREDDARIEMLESRWKILQDNS